MKRSRRRFLRLLAAGSAAAWAAPIAAATTAPETKGRGRTGAKPAAAPAATTAKSAQSALAEEIRKQKISVDQALKAVRDYPLPPGSVPAFRFAPAPVRGKERTP
jgi:hypothetical protein